MRSWGAPVSVWVIIPAKDPRLAKSRLAPALAPSERILLAERLLDATLRAALVRPAVDGAIVVSTSATLRALAARHGALTVADPPTAPAALTSNARTARDGTNITSDDALRQAPDPLNAAILAGCRRGLELGASAALILPTDLPLLCPSTIVDFLDEAGDAAVALAPDRSGSGTNALLLRPPLAISPQFGPASFLRHRMAARHAGLRLTTIRLPALAFDLDTPDDLALLSGPPAPLEARYG